MVNKGCLITRHPICKPNNTSYIHVIKLKHMKQIVGKTGTALLITWIIGMIVILLIGLSADGPIDSPAFINVWTFYGFVLGTPAVAAAMMGWANKA